MASDQLPSDNFEAEKWRVEHEFALEKWRAEHALRTREVALKEQDQALHDDEILIKKQEVSLSRWTNPLALAIFGAAFAGLVNAWLTSWNNRYQLQLEDTKARATIALEQSKSEAARILEMIKTNDSDRAAENLRFLIETGLISDEKIVQQVRKFLADRKKGTGPFLSSSAIGGAGSTPCGPEKTRLICYFGECSKVPC
jgi:hypothetical protein